MFEDYDSEDRARIAGGALDALTGLVEHQAADEEISSARLAPLLRLVTEMVKLALPVQMSCRRRAND